MLWQYVLVSVALDPSHCHLCASASGKREHYRRLVLAFTAQLFCCIIKWMGISVTVSTPCGCAPPAVLCYRGSNCTASLCFRLCPQPYITRAFAHCASWIMYHAQETLKNYLRSLCNFTPSSAGFITGRTPHCSVRTPSLHWTRIHLFVYHSLNQSKLMASVYLFFCYCCRTV